MARIQPQNIIIHHSATRDGTANDWDAIRRYHMSWRYQGRVLTPEEGAAMLAKKIPGVERPDIEIGYHRGFERVGSTLVLREGRAIGEPGAHCRELAMNFKSIGYCIVGNFDLAPPDVEILKAVAAQAKADCATYGIPVNAILGHREVGAMAGFDWRRGQYKSCPGKHFPMDTLRALVAGARPA
jgi:hypothetical protein